MVKLAVAHPHPWGLGPYLVLYELPSVKEAARWAIVLPEGSRPVRIYEDEALIWEDEGRHSPSYQRLQELAGDLPNVPKSDSAP